MNQQTHQKCSKWPFLPASLGSVMQNMPLPEPWGLRTFHLLSSSPKPSIVPALSPTIGPRLTAGIEVLSPPVARGAGRGASPKSGCKSEWGIRMPRFKEDKCQPQRPQPPQRLAKMLAPVGPKEAKSELVGGWARLDSTVRQHCPLLASV